MDIIASLKNLEAAWHKVREKKGLAGGDEVSIEEFGQKLWANLKQMAVDLKRNRYNPRPLKYFYMEKANGKTRLIGILSVQDRVAQRAVLNAIAPFYERRFLPCSFGYRPGKSVDMALQKTLELYNQGFIWVVDGDIESYFDTIPHEPLKRILASDIRDRRVQRVINMWLNGSTLQGLRRAKNQRGILQGGVISPLLANIYLHRFDEILVERKRQLIRFGDDFIVMCRSEREALHCLQEIRSIFKRLGLSINEQKTSVLPFKRGFSFLGKTILPSAQST